MGKQKSVCRRSCLPSAVPAAWPGARRPSAVPSPQATGVCAPHVPARAPGWALCPAAGCPCAPPGECLAAWARAVPHRAESPRQPVAAGSPGCGPAPRSSSASPAAPRRAGPGGGSRAAGRALGAGPAGARAGLGGRGRAGGGGSGTPRAGAAAAPGAGREKVGTRRSGRVLPARRCPAWPLPPRPPPARLPPPRGRPGLRLRRAPAPPALRTGPARRGQGAALCRGLPWAALAGGEWPRLGCCELGWARSPRASRARAACGPPALRAQLGARCAPSRSTHAALEVLRAPWSSCAAEREPPVCSPHWDCGLLSRVCSGRGNPGGHHQASSWWQLALPGQLVAEEHLAL